MAVQQAQTKLSDASKKEIDLWLQKFPPEQKKPVVIHALMFVQKENNGYLTRELMDAVADYLDLAPIEVYEVATFYSMYDLEKVGKNKIYVCTNVSCMLCGCDVIVEHLKKKLKIEFGQTTKDGKFTLKEVECLAACGGAPAMQVNDDYYENLTPAKVDEILVNLE